MKKRFIFIFFILTIFLSGCVKLDLALKVNEDGSVDADYILAIDKSFYALMKAEGEDPFEEMETEWIMLEFDYEKYEDEKYTGFRAFQRYNNIKQYSLFTTGATDSGAFTLDIEEGFFQKKYILEGSLESINDILLEGMNEELGDLGNLSEEEQMFMDMYFDALELSFIVELPGKIGSNNADSVKNGKLQWEIDLDDAKKIHAESTVINFVPFIIIGAVAAVIILIIIFIVSKRRKKRRMDGPPFSGHQPYPNEPFPPNNGPNTFYPNQQQNQLWNHPNQNQNMNHPPNQYPTLSQNQIQNRQQTQHQNTINQQMGKNDNIKPQPDQSENDNNNNRQ